MCDLRLQLLCTASGLETTKIQVRHASLRFSANGLFLLSDSDSNTLTALQYLSKQSVSHLSVLNVFSLYCMRMFTLVTF